MIKTTTAYKFNNKTLLPYQQLVHKPANNINFLKPLTMKTEALKHTLTTTEALSQQQRTVDSTMTANVRQDLYAEDKRGAFETDIGRGYGLGPVKLKTNLAANWFRAAGGNAHQRRGEPLLHWSAQLLAKYLNFQNRHNPNGHHMSNFYYNKSLQSRFIRGLQLHWLKTKMLDKSKMKMTCEQYKGKYGSKVVY